MSYSRAQRRILLYGVLPAFILYFGLRIYAQYRHVDVFVSREAPMPAELAAGLHISQHKIEPLVQIDSPYETASNKMLDQAELRGVRSALAWGGKMPVFIDSLSIQSPTRVLARRSSSRAMHEYQLVKRGGRWLIESVTRSEIRRRPS